MTTGRLCAWCARLTANASLPLQLDPGSGEIVSAPAGGEGLAMAAQRVGEEGWTAFDTWQGRVRLFAVTTIDGFEVCEDHVQTAWDRADLYPRRR